MSNHNSRKISNHFQDVRLVSLSSWSRANEISPRDRGGPYVVLQEGYDPEDPQVRTLEFVLGRSGKWLSLSHFFKLPVPDRRAEFIFGTAGEVMQLMSDLPPKVVIFGKPEAEAPQAEPAEPDEMQKAFTAAQSQSSGKGQPSTSA